MGDDSRGHQVGGEVFGAKYQCLGELGSGGFGKVYRARQLTTGQDVAVKVIPVIFDGSGTSSDDRHFARLEREMTLSARLQHPNIVRLLDSGRSDDGRIFAVFAYIPGETIGQVIKREGPFSLDETIYLMGQVLDALAAAHKQGVVHRDLKPSNIMLTTTGVRRNAMVLDFGIGASVRDLHDERLAKLTGTGEMVGTPHYAPPEQIHGHSATPRSDLYSWALLFLECLTGAPVIRGKSFMEIIYQQISPNPIAIPKVITSPSLRALLQQLLEKNVDKRDITAQEALERLERCRLEVSSPDPSARVSADRAATVDFGRTLGITRGGEGTMVTLHPTSSISRERRQLTVLGCSLKLPEDTVVEEELEVYDEAIDLLWGFCREISRRFKGYLATTTNDGATLYFGYPDAHEDDALRAIRAARELVGIARRTSGAPADPPRPDLSVGVHTGMVIARSGTDSSGMTTLDVVGPTTSMAMKLSALAPPGKVWVSESTRALLQDEDSLTPRGERHLSGRSTPILVFELDEDAWEPRRSQTRVVVQAGRLVGREQELGFLCKQWRRSVDGEGQSALITGEAGIGKSRLALELVAEARSGIHPSLFLECRCAEESKGSPFRPIAELLEQLVGLSPEMTGEAKTSRLRKFLEEQGFQLQESMPIFCSLLSLPQEPRYPSLELSPTQRKEATFEAVLTLIFKLAEREPLLLLVEDLHWADQSSLEVLEMLVEEVPEASIYVVLTARPEFAPESSAWSSSSLFTLKLDRLEPSKVEEMVSALAPNRGLPEALVAEVVRRTDGVCLYVEELTRMLLRERDGASSASTMTQNGSGAVASVPATLRDLLTSRLDQLGTAKRTVQLASVIGREFSQEMLASVSPLSAEELESDLRSLISADLIRRRRIRRLRKVELVFKHALIRDTAYSSLLKSEQARFHGDIATAIESKLPEMAENRPDLLAKHHARAGRKKVAVGYAIKAGKAALMRSAISEALLVTTEAVEWVGELDPDPERIALELELNSLIIPAAMALKGFVAPESESAAHRILALREVAGDNLAVFAALYALTMRHHVLCDRAKARSLGEQLLEVAENLGDDGLIGAALPTLAQCCWCDGENEFTVELCERGVALYDPAKHVEYGVQFGTDSLAYARMTMSLSLWILGSPDRAVAEAEAAVEQARKLGMAHTLGMALFFLAQVHTFRGEREKVLSVAEELESVCLGREHRLRGKEELKLHLPPISNVLTERLTEALCKKFGTQIHLQVFAGILKNWVLRNAAQLAQYIEYKREAHQMIGITFYYGLLADVYAKNGDDESALRVLDDTLELAQNFDRWNSILLPQAKGEALIRLGRSEEGEQCLHDAVDLNHSLNFRMPALMAAVSLFKHCRENGRAAESRPKLQAVVDSFIDEEPPLLAEARRLLSISSVS